MEPLSILVLGFAAGATATGFFKKLGEDLYDQFKAKLKAAVQKRHGKERLLVLRTVTIAPDGRRVAVQLVLTDPTESEVEYLLRAGLPKVDSVVAATLQRNPNAVEVVLALEDEEVRVLYWLRDDGVPSVIQSMPHELMMAQGLSLSAVVIEREPDSATPGASSS